MLVGSRAVLLHAQQPRHLSNGLPGFLIRDSVDHDECDALGCAHVSLRNPLRGQRPAAIALALVGLLELLLLMRTDWTTGAKSVAGKASGPGPDVEKLARLLFTRYILAFEMTSLLLVIAIVGAVVLSRRPERLLGGDNELEVRNEGATP